MPSPTAPTLCPAHISFGAARTTPFCIGKPGVPHRFGATGPPRGRPEDPPPHRVGQQIPYLGGQVPSDQEEQDRQGDQHRRAPQQRDRRAIRRVERPDAGGIVRVHQTRETDLLGDQPGKDTDHRCHDQQVDRETEQQRERQIQPNPGGRRQVIGPAPQRRELGAALGENLTPG